MEINQCEAAEFFDDLPGFVEVIRYEASVRAANFILEAENCGGLKWRGNRSGNRNLKVPSELKNRWAVILRKEA